MTTSLTVAPSSFLTALTRPSEVERKANRRCGRDRRVEAACGARPSVGQRTDRLALVVAGPAEVEHGAERSPQAATHLVGRGHEHRVAGGLSQLTRRAGAEQHGPARLADQRPGGLDDHLAVARHPLGAPAQGGDPGRTTRRRARPDHHRAASARRRSHRPRPGPSTSSPSTVVSSIIVSSSAPDAPSTVAWWILVRMANRPFGQPLDDVGLPQRAGPIERATDEPGHQLAELVVVAGRRDGGLPHVEVEVERVVLDPVRVVEPEGHHRAAAAAAARAGATAGRSACRHAASGS